MVSRRELKNAVYKTLLCLLAAPMFHITMGSPVKCEEPSKDDLHKTYLDSLSVDLHPSFFLHPKLRGTINFQDSTVHVNHVPFSGPNYADKEKRCPSSPAKGANDELAARSTCPFYYVSNHDENRYPRDLMEVRCSCEDSCSGTTVAENVTGLTHCEATFYVVPVLRRSQCSNGNYAWTPSWQKLAVACMCAFRPQVQEK